MNYDHESQILRRPIDDIFHSNTSLLQTKLIASYKNGKRFHSEKELISTIDGNELPVEIWSHPMLKQGEAVGSVITFFDKTHTLNDQDKILQLSQVVEQSSIATSITDLEGSIEYVNSFFTQLNGYTEKEVIGRNCSILSAKKTDKTLYRDLWSTVVNGNSWQGELQNKTKNGDLYWAKLIITPIRNSDNKISHFLGLTEDITEARRLKQEIHQQAFYDHLTGLPNRLLILDRMDVAIKSAQRKQVCLAILFIDINKFKPINDTYGHKVGDNVLKVSANRLSNAMRSSDTVGRLSGDEFVVIINEPGKIEDDRKKTIEVMQKVTNKIIEQFSRPIITGEHKLDVSVSIGGAISPDNGDNSKDILHRADLAMYHAKKSEQAELCLYR